MIQLLPAADDAVIDRLEKNIQEIPPVTAMLQDGMTPEEIVRLALADFEVEVLYEQEVAYRCDCSRDRVERALMSMGSEELRGLIEEKGEAEVTCHFCDKAYHFDKAQLEALESRS